tara:strand:- start:524 stop:1753 length:1230 start_codon:yes stop_codon:yes gene_type:complete
MFKYSFLLFYFIPLFINAQILPTYYGVNFKKGTTPSSELASLIFDGINDRVTTNLSMSNWSAFTFEAWVYPETTGNREGIVGHNDIIEFGFIDSNTIHLWTARGSSKNWDFNSSKLPFNTWHHIVGVGDGTANSNNLKIYVNGVLKAQGGSAPSGGHYGSSNYKINIGAGAYDPLNTSLTNKRVFDGNLDEIRIWNDARTLEEIKSNMFKNLAGDEDNLQLYYKMSANSGQSLTDNSSNSNVGSIEGGTSWGITNVPLGSLSSSYQTDMEGLWEASGTAASQDSDGLSMSVGVTLDEEDFAIFGNNNTDNTSTQDLPSGESLEKRSAREWQVDETGTVIATVIIDISDATGNSVSPAAATNYKLLFKSSASGDFSVNATGASISGDVITFSNVALQDGFYAIASTDSNL